MQAVTRTFWLIFLLLLSRLVLNFTEDLCQVHATVLALLHLEHRPETLAYTEPYQKLLKLD